MAELLALQADLVARQLALPSTAKKLFRDIRQQLKVASDAGKIRSSLSEIYGCLKLLSEPVPEVLRQLSDANLQQGAYSIVGGEKNFHRDPRRAHLRRDDDAWFDFSLTVREQGDHIELLAYDFEIRMPPGHGAPFLRFDLNLPDHVNTERELRSHLHFGSDDLLVPAPMMTPRELLSLFIDGMRFQSSRTPRRPTRFEMEWLKKSIGGPLSPQGE